MIKIKIISSTDRGSIGVFSFPIHYLEIGPKVSHTLRILDGSIKDTLCIKVIEKNKALLLISNSNYYLSNGKKFTGSKTLSEGDNIQIGTLNFEVLEISITEGCPIDSGKYRRELIDKLKKEDPELYNILGAIEEDIIKLGLL